MILLLLLQSFIFLLLSPSAALAVQTHGPPEGLYVHMMAHIFFSAAIVFLLYLLHKRPLGVGPAWKHMKISLILWLLWNMDTFVVHYITGGLPSEAFTTSNGFLHTVLPPPLDIKRIIYYLGKFDHVLCVPAIWFLALSLKNFRDEARQRLSSKKAEGSV